MKARRPTIHDVAARAGVSKSLVSLALRGSDKVSPESRAAILAAAEELGYRPNAAARNLAARQSHTIGVLILDFHNPIFAQVLDGVQSVVRAAGYNLMLVTGNADGEVEAAEVTKLLEFQVEGLILIAHRMPGDALQRFSEECPVVVITRRDSRGPDIATVSSDDVQGGRLATEHLITLGHRAIGHISGGGARIARDREAGYVQAMTAAGLTPLMSAGDFTDSGGYSATRALLDAHPGLTALFVANDLSAIGAMSAIADTGRRVPEDVSVIGYDGMGLGGIPNLSLTTMAQPLTEMGAAAAEELFGRLKNGSFPHGNVEVPVTLLQRGSTAAPAIG